MTLWGLFLLCAFVGLGLGPTTVSKAGRLVAALTLFVLAGVLVQYGALR